MNAHENPHHNHRLHSRLLAAAGLLAALPFAGTPLNAAAAADSASDAAVALAPASVAAGFDTGTPSLRDYLTRRRAALFASQIAPASAPQTLRAKVTAESRSGVRRLRIRDFQYLSDSDRGFAGYSLGAPSWDTEVAVIASSVADEFLIHAAAKGIPLDSVEVTVTSRPDAPAVEKTRKVSYPRNITWTAYIESPATDARLEELRNAVERTSPVLALLREPQGIPHGAVVYTQTPAVRDPALPPGLRDFLVEKRVAVLRHKAEAEERAKNPSAERRGYRLHAEAKVEDGSGIRNTRTADLRFQILHDNPRDAAGYNLAPTSNEHQLGVLGTCITHITEIQAAARNVVLDSIEVRVEGVLTPRIGSGETAPPRYKNVRYTVHIESPAPESEILALRDAVEATCPIYNLLNDSQEIKGVVVRGKAPAVLPAQPR